MKHYHSHCSLNLIGQRNKLDCTVIVVETYVTLHRKLFLLNKSLGILVDLDTPICSMNHLPLPPITLRPVQRMEKYDLRL